MSTIYGKDTYPRELGQLEGGPRKVAEGVVRFQRVVRLKRKRKMIPDQENRTSLGEDPVIRIKKKIYNVENIY